MIEIPRLMTNLREMMEAQAQIEMFKVGLLHASPSDTLSHWEAKYEKAAAVVFEQLTDLNRNAPGGNAWFGSYPNER